MAIALMIQLARKPDQTIGSSELVTELGLTRSYLEKLIADLRKAGLIESSRGVSGGFWLSRDASDISALDIFRAIEPASQLWRTPHLAASSDERRVQEFLDVLQRLDHLLFSHLSLADLARGSLATHPAVVKMIKCFH